MRSLLKRTLVSGITAALVASASIGVAASGAGRTEAATASRSRPQSGVGQAVLRTSGLRADVWPVTECGTYSGRGCSPTSARVDLERPTFSNPTNITNPLFPISTLDSVALLGVVDGKPFRAETKRLPQTDVVNWDGQRVEVVISQYTAYLDGLIDEVAIDRYAQADDGSVWYLGEDVFDYRDGAIAITEGTWLAGRDGPAAMIMPANPKVGDVFRAESVVGIVFEELEVKAINQTVDGPRGPVSGVVVMSELHLDGTHSNKVFAPGYGEFDSSHGPDTEALAVAAPTDVVGTEIPNELKLLSSSAWGILENARLEDWDGATPTLGRINRLWKAVKADQPPRVVATMRKALRALARGVKKQNPGVTAQAAVDVAQAAIDLQLRYGGRVDVARFHLHSQQLRVHAAADNAAGVTGEVGTLEWIRDRIASEFDAATQVDLDAGLRDLRTAADAGNLAASSDIAARLAARIRSVAGR